MAPLVRWRNLVLFVFGFGIISLYYQFGQAPKPLGHTALNTLKGTGSKIIIQTSVETLNPEESEIDTKSDDETSSTEEVQETTFKQVIEELSTQIRDTIPPII